MKKLLFIFTGLIFLGITVSFYSCEKENLVANTTIEDELFPENSEMIIDGELFIDGVSQKEVITDFDIEGVEVIDGRLAFVDHDAMMDAIHKLAEYNTESVLAWSAKIGFTSLFTELIRIEEKPLEEIKAELNKGMYKEYFNITESGELELSKHSIVHARILSSKGIIQVGNYVGTFFTGLNVWVKPEKTPKLLSALKNHSVNERDKDFFILDKSAFNNNKDWIHVVTCPKDGPWLGSINQYKNPNAKRRIDVQNQYDPLATYAGNGLWNATATYWMHSTSKKASWNKYKTNHYHSIDVRVQRMTNISSPTPVGSEITLQTTQNINNTKTAHSFITIFVYSNVSASFLNNNWVRLTRTIPGSSGQTGTAASHRGMGGRYGRQDCS